MNGSCMIKEKTHMLKILYAVFAVSNLYYLTHSKSLFAAMSRCLFFLLLHGMAHHLGDLPE